MSTELFDDVMGSAVAAFQIPMIQLKVEKTDCLHQRRPLFIGRQPSNSDKKCLRVLPDCIAPLCRRHRAVSVDPIGRDRGETGGVRPVAKGDRYGDLAIGVRVQR
jgi:hypothetical protein